MCSNIYFCACHHQLLKSIEQWCILLLKNWTFYLWLGRKMTLCCFQRDSLQIHSCTSDNWLACRYFATHPLAYLRPHDHSSDHSDSSSEQNSINHNYFFSIDDNKSTCYLMSWFLFNDEVPVNLDSGKQSKNELPSTGSTSTARSPTSEICWAWAAWSGGAGSSWGWFCSCP